MHVHRRRCRGTRGIGYEVDVQAVGYCEGGVGACVQGWFYDAYWGFEGGGDGGWWWCDNVGCGGGIGISIATEG